MLTDRSRKALSLCSTLAIATALMMGSGTARAQSFQGNGTFAFGSGTITTPTPITTVIDLTSNDAVIDWSVFPALDTTNNGVPIIFQPSGTTATFQRASDFSVLNRIIPTDASRPIQFNGTVVAQIQGASTVPGGSVYFYSPGGVIVGSTAVFNVGNLGLTSIAPAVVGGVFEQTNPVTGLEFVQFTGAVRPGSAVTIQPGARITSNGTNGSYVAIVAPLVNNAGTINVNGAAALVSADAATITFNPTGLFDIQVTSGTSSTGNGGNGRTLINTGTVTGPAFGGTGPLHRIYAVAVPKNNAITMIVGDGSSLGFNIAEAADVVGNAVILSAGHDIAGGQIVAAPSAGGGSGSVMIDSFNSNYTSEVVASATGRALFGSDGTVGAGSTNFAANLTAHSDTIVSIEGRSGGSASVAGNLNLDANAFAATPTSSVVAGNAYIDSRNGASVTVGGNALLLARGQGGNATGGNADATADTGGTVNIGGVLRVRAEGIGGSGGSGTGGMATINARADGDIVASQLNVSADGLGGADSAGSGAGAGKGGNAAITASGAGSTITVANGNSSGTNFLGELDFLSAEGFGGSTSGGGSAIGGAGTGGTATIDVNSGATLSGPANVGSTGLVRVIARGTGGNGLVDGTTGGQATGGNINITIDNATMTSAEMLPSAFAQGGGIPFISEGPGGTVNGGNAVGGNRHITVRNGGTLTTSLGGGSAGAVGGNATQSGRGGDASGGNASLTVDNATFNVTDRALFFTQNTGGDGGTGGNATGGLVSADIRNGGMVNVSMTGANQLFLVAADNRGGNSFTAAGAIGGNATGGLGQILLNGGTLNAPNVHVSGIGVGGNGLLNRGGNGAGGTARLQLNGGTLTGTRLTVDASGAGGSIDPSVAGDGGNGIGGLATIDSNTNATALNFTRVDVLSQGLGGVSGGLGGNGGAGSGGTGQIIVTGGSNLTANVPDTFLKADGEGGDALGSSGNGGAGNAGRSIVSIDGASATFDGTLNLAANSVGGDGIAAGNAFGDPENTISRASVFVRNGSLAVTGLASLHARANGGQGRLAGNGGNASGGLASLVAANGNNTTGPGIITLANLAIDSGAQGGSATGTGDGGDAGAGRARLFINGGNITVAGGVDLVAKAIGGDGINGGDAISARPDFQPRALIAGSNGTISVAGAALLDSSAFGGDARSAGAGGIAFAGDSAIDAQSNNGPSTITLGSLSIDASATGGFGGNGVGSQVGGGGGDAYGGVTSAFGNAGRGVLNIAGSTVVNAAAFGGDGGQGGTGATGAAGGVGGRAFGGAITLGTRSGFDTPSNTGSATFNGPVNGDSSAFGGNGGAGGSGTTAGAGGAGGTGFGGSAGILVRGSPATFGNVTLTSSGLGGDGGAGSTQGDGGDGYAGDGFLIATQRYQRTERGTLTAGDVAIATAGVGGAGATAGDSFYGAAQGTEGDLFVRQSDIDVGNLLLSTSGALAPNFTTTILSTFDPVAGQIIPSGIPAPRSVTVAVEPFDLSLTDSTIDVAGSLTVLTSGALRVSLGSSTVNTANLRLDAGNFVLPATRPATLGTFNVSNALSISSGLDIFAYANFRGAGNGFFDANGSILLGDLAFADLVQIDALGSIDTGSVQGRQVGMAAGTRLATGAVTAGESIDLVAADTLTTGQLTAGDSVEARAGGALAVAGASAGIATQSSISGAEYNVALRSLTSISAGDLAARGSIGVASPGTIALGNLTTGAAGVGFLALAGTALTTGGIDTSASAGGGRVYLANFSMEALGGEITGVFDPAPILAATPVAIGGPITLNGPVSTGRFQAATSGAFTGQTITAPRGFDLSAGAAISLGDLSSFVVNVSSGQSLALGAVTATATSAQLAAGGLTRAVTLSASNGALTTAAITSAGSVDLSGSQALNTGTINVTDGALRIGSGGAAKLGNLYVRDTLTINAASLAMGSLYAGLDARITTAGAASIGSATVGFVASQESAGTFVVDATTHSVDRGMLLPAFQVVAGQTITVSSSTNDLWSAGPLPRFSDGNGLVATRFATADDDSGQAPGTQIGANFGTLGVGNINVPFGSLVGNVGGTFVLLGANGQVTAPATGLLTLGFADSGSSDNFGSISFNLSNLVLGNQRPASLFVTSGGGLSIGATSATAAIDLRSGGAMALGTLSAGTSIDLLANLDLSVGAVTAGTSVEMDAGGSIRAGNITAGESQRLFAGTTAALGDLVAGSSPETQFSVGVAASGEVTIGKITATRDIGLLSKNAGITSGAIVTGTSAGVLANGAVVLGNVTTGTAANNFLYIANASMAPLGGALGPNFNPAPIFAATPVATSGAISVGTVTGGNVVAATTQGIGIGAINGLAVRLNAGLGLTTAGINAQTIGLGSSGGAVTTGALQAGDSIEITGATGVTINGAASAGIASPSTSPTAQYKVAISGGTGSVTTGAVSAQRDLGIQAGGSVTTGDLRGRDVLLLAGSNVSTGAIAATVGSQATGRVYVGNVSQASPTANVFSSFVNLPIFNVVPSTPVGGNITFGGGVQAGTVIASASGDFNAQAITAASRINVAAGGLAAIGGAWRSPGIEVVSRDIDITATGSLDALSLTGEIQLASTNPNGMFVGDNTGAASGSYQLSNAEFGRLKAGRIEVVGDDLSGTVDMVVGDLGVTAAQVYTDGQALFATGNRATQTPSGILRINGNVAASGFGLDSPGGLTFLSGTLELNAATGSLNVTSSGNAIAGTIEIDARRIHVASDEILLRLRADPLYAGHVEQLNAPAAVQRPEGVVRAGALALFPSETFYIQNTGSTIAPAGFLTRLDSTEIDIGGGISGSSTAKAELVFNGQFQTSTGVVTGKAAFDLALAQARADAMADGETFGANITDASTFNNCGILSGTCALAGSMPLAPPASEITVIVSTPLATSPPPPPVDDAGPGDSSGSGSDSEAAEESDGGESQDEEEGDGGDEAASPIAPPTPLISTRALDGDVTVVEPVSGAGNPALFGSAVNETTVEGEKP